MATQTTNYNLSKPEATDPFSQFRQSYNDNMDIIDANLGGGGGGGGHTIIDPLGQNMPSRTGLQFIGASVTDDSVNDKTVVTITGGGGGHNYSTTEQVIGTWIDGKPLYAKTWVLTIPSATGTYSFNEATPSLKNVVHTEYSLWGLGERESTPWYTPATILFSEQTASYIEFYFASTNYAGREIYYTSYYTKTTD